MTKIPRIISKILNITIPVVLVFIIVFNLLTIIVQKGENGHSVLGFSTAVVLSGSMADAIEVNDMIVTHRQEEYQVGDIIMYEDEVSTVTHRIVAIEEDGYLTKGDANDVDDGEPIAEERVIGKVICIIPKVGALLSFFRTPLGMMLFVFGFLLMIGRRSREC